MGNQLIDVDLRPNTKKQEQNSNWMHTDLVQVVAAAAGAGAELAWAQDGRDRATWRRGGGCRAMMSLRRCRVVREQLAGGDQSRPANCGHGHLHAHRN